MKDMTDSIFGITCPGVCGLMFAFFGPNPEHYIAVCSLGLCKILAEDSSL